MPQNENLEKIKDEVLSGDMTHADKVRKPILESWLRSYEHGVSLNAADKSVLSAAAVASRIEARQEYCDIAFKYIDDIRKYSAGTGFMLSLTDEEGYILFAVGDPDIMEAARENKLVVGCNRSEAKLGTNGIGTTLAIGEPMQVIGSEHYYKLHYNWTCSGAPIFYPNGDPAGVFCLIGRSEKANVHTLGMAVNVAEAISSKLALSSREADLNRVRKDREVLMDSFASGVLILDKTFEILEANDIACEILGVPFGDLIGKKIEEVVSIEGIKPKHFKAGVQEKLVTPKQGEHSSIMITIRPVRSEYVVALTVPDSFVSSGERKGSALARFSFSDVIGESQSMQNALKLAKRASENLTNVFINGESGTGKELFAQAIHSASPRRNGPFVAVNCSAIPQGLIESELFGYEGGSFTGSLKEGSAGKFELADGGTLFLDEIGDMPLDAQTALLRVLQNREVTRVGSGKSIPVDVRIITATNRNLSDMINAGTIREDLYYRINVFPIRVPPLRERKGDVSVLARYFLEKYRDLNESVRVTSFSKDAASIMESYWWPGNVRQLENAIERAVAISEDSIIRTDCLPQEIVEAVLSGGSSPKNAYNAYGALGGERKSESFESIKDLERRQIEEALRASRGNVSRTAELTGISRRNLYRKLEQYGIDPSDYRNRG